MHPFADWIELFSTASRAEFGEGRTDAGSLTCGKVKIGADERAMGEAAEDLAKIEMGLRVQEPLGREFSWARLHGVRHSCDRPPCVARAWNWGSLPNYAACEFGASAGRSFFGRRFGLPEVDGADMIECRARCFVLEVRVARGNFRSRMA